MVRESQYGMHLNLSGCPASAELRGGFAIVSHLEAGPARAMP